MFRRVLVANRGEIAWRVIRSLRRLGVESIAVYSEADHESPHVREADVALPLGGKTAAESYLRGDRILELAHSHGAQAIHPGYGFLSENADFAAACESSGLAFVGPTPEQIRKFGLKNSAREAAQACAVPLLPGSGLLADPDQALAEAARIGYPVMLKSVAGGGGIGMRAIYSEADLAAAFASVRALAGANFRNDGVYLEKLVAVARHVEVQIFGDGLGRALALGERDCSLQRRNQKVIEETPAPGLADSLRAELHDAARRLAESVAYRNAGTVEFIYDEREQRFYFLEVNTRLQVEHGVTENVLGIDLVEWMLRLAAGERNFLPEQPPSPKGCSIQARIYAEDPARNFQPCSGRFDLVSFPANVRVDHWIESGATISPYYDPLLAKVMAVGEDRPAALRGLRKALKESELYGVETNRDYLIEILNDPRVAQAQLSTRLLDDIRYRPMTVEVLNAGPLSSVQAYPGRTGYWHVGVPPSGPMDSLSFRLGNRLLGNDEGAAGIEMTISGASLRFHGPALCCLAGAEMSASLDGKTIETWSVFAVEAGQLLRIGGLRGAGQRAYLLFGGGLDVAEYLGSKSAFVLGGFGGHGGRALAPGDVLHLAAEKIDWSRVGQTLPAALRPDWSDAWQLAVLSGPHTAPEFFDPDFLDEFYSVDWQVHYNSARTGVRLIGPRPRWARSDGGEAGLHPSNLHDNAYAIGAVDFTGDMPILLGPDGPSLGGFVCPAVLLQSELWKMGQLRPGDRLRFVRVSAEDGADALRAQNERIAQAGAVAPPDNAPGPTRIAHRSFPDLADDAILLQLLPPERPYAFCVRQQGEGWMLVEYGAMRLDFHLRFRVHALMLAVQAENPRGVFELTPGIRSLQVRYDPLQWSRKELCALLERLERALPQTESMEVPTRVLRLPLSWNDPAVVLATEKYMQSVWAEAPWCPDNIEFIRRINGLKSREEVKSIVYGARYLTLGLGDVYLGAPVATPIDPRHRLVTTKYNPARTWTPPNAVGIGGAYLCIYGMEGPGGYQFVGRTCQVWNTHRRNASFGEHPWLLRFFDQLQFYEVSAEELLDFRADFECGRQHLTITNETFRMAAYDAMLRDEAASIAAFEARRSEAFQQERERWLALAPPPEKESSSHESHGEIMGLSELAEIVLSPMHANVWKIHVAAGVKVAAGEALATLEAMKMEIQLDAPVAGVVSHVLCETGKAVQPGQGLFIIDTGAPL